MIDAVVLVGVLCGCLSAWKGNLTAWALLASVALSSGLIWLGVPFDPKLWIRIDMLVSACILLFGSRPVKDWIIVAMFFPVAVLYTRANSSDAINLIVALQFVLTLPFKRLLLRAHKTNLATQHWEDFDLFKVVARVRA